MLKKCLIANRGEIAVRIIRTCKLMDMVTVAVASEIDAHALHVSLADEAVIIGAASPSVSYLNVDALIEAALSTGADCVHPGYGFLSENAEFAERVIAAGLVWVGPPPAAIRAMGVKTEARSIMEAAGVPLVPGFQSADADLETFTREAARIGYPVMVKAAGGGGGKGIRVVQDAAGLSDALESARREAQKAFGDPRVFLERYIEHGRHIEVQVLADQHGNVIHLGERECSTQRRHQKIVEESPSPLLNNEQRAAICLAGVEAARAVGYVNAGTVEFIATPEGEFYFLEMNTRLQVEHPVTEMVTGFDLVQLQMQVASGEVLPITQQMVMQRGHAIECRIYAEDPHNGFLPAIGPVLRFVPPVGPGVRVDSGVRTGDEVSMHYDPMIAKVITCGATRQDALQRMEQALAETVVQGVTTNVAFLNALIRSDAFKEAQIDTTYVDRELHNLLPAAPPPSDAALIAAALAELVSSLESGHTISGDTASPWNRADGFRLWSSAQLQ
jgi:acetyl-CoA carboxylase biotin carboxylase subunit